ncbi:MAG TPA: tail fiber domain-containing protein, partial [Chthonomonadales bacterium]|nr:tail fiber domain-containing protein [Chthonomonadales bacterium]
ADTSIGNAQANADLANLSASANIWSGLMSAAGAAAGAYAKSDIRSKDDVEEVGKLHSGEPVVRFRYKGDPKTQLGLIAQHVEKVTPDAVREFHTDIRPMKYVDYKRATDLAAGLAKFLQQVA